MPTIVNMHEAKTSLSKLVKLVEQGEEVVIARDGKPVARLTCVTPPRKKNLPYGVLKGKLKILGGFDEIPEEFNEYI